MLTLAAIIIALALAVYGIVTLSRRPRLTVVEFRKLNGVDAMITLSDGRRLRGGGTVWSWFPSGRRASTRIEWICSDEWTRQMWNLEKK